MTGRRGEYRRQWTAFAAIYGLFCQLVLTSLAIPAAFAATLPGALPAGYTTIVICTGTGMKRITLDADGTPVEEQTSDNATIQCTACHIAGGTLLSPIDAAELTARAYTPVQMRPLVGQTLCTKTSCVCPDSRAPPIEL